MSPISNKMPRGHWEHLGPALPSALENARVLLAAPATSAADLAPQLAGRGAEVVEWNPVDAPPPEPAGFELVVCVGLLQTDPHPARILTALWGAMGEGGTMFVHSQVIDDRRQSRYARFVAAATGTGGAEWLPGRLALRWSLETSGFDVDRWLSPGYGSTPGGEASAYLVASRTVRWPSLILATPTDHTEMPDGQG